MNPTDYWERRYSRGGDSGRGSRGENAETKATEVNRLIEREQVASVIDWGCGDGVVLKMIDPQVPYLGIDVSKTMIARLMISQHRHLDRRFLLASNYRGERADLALSMDVLQHFQHDTDYHLYLNRLLGSACRLVLIYGTDYDAPPAGQHMRRRRFTPDVADQFGDWALTEQPDDVDEPGFYLYRRDL